MDATRNNKKSNSDQLIQRIADQEEPSVFGEIWKSKTQGDPAIVYHYYKVVRDYSMGKRVIVTDKMRPEHEEARRRAGERASQQCLVLDGKA